MKIRMHARLFRFHSFVSKEVQAFQSLYSEAVVGYLCLILAITTRIAC